MLTITIASFNFAQILHGWSLNHCTQFYRRDQRRDQKGTGRDRKNN